MNTLIICVAYFVGALTYSLTDDPGIQWGAVLLAGIALSALSIVANLVNDQ